MSTYSEKKVIWRIKFLYPDKYKYFYKELQIIIEDFEKRIPKKKIKKPLFTEKDIVLLCYPDHVKEPNVKTLRTMRKFLKGYVKGYFNKIHFLPFHPYSADEGFSVIDHYKVHKPFGTWSDIKKISKEFGLVSDLVINHVSTQSEWFKRFLEGDERYKDFFIAFKQKVDTSKVFRPRADPLLVPFETKEGKKYVWCTFPLGQADLNYSNPEVLLEMIKVLLFHIEKGAEAIRLDAVAYVWKKLGTSCFNLPQTHTIIKLIRDILKQLAPHVWLITEAVMPHKKNLAFFGGGYDETHLIYDFVLETLLLLTIIKKDSCLATRWLNTLKSPSDETTFLNLTISHDGLHVVPSFGIISKEDLELIAENFRKKGGEILYRSISGKNPQPYEFETTYLSAIGDVDAFLATQSIQLALKGVPLIYFNNLIGAENWYGGFKKSGHVRSLNRERFNYEGLVEELKKSGSTKNRVYRGYTKLLSARVNEPLFSPLAKQKVLYFGSSLIAILRHNNKDKLLALTNVTDKTVDINSSKIVDVLRKTSVQDLISKNTIKLKGALSLKPYQILWLK